MPAARPSAAPVRHAGVHPADDVDWQRLWFATQTRPWRVLAVISTAKDAAPALEVATALAEVGEHHLGRKIPVIDATRCQLAELEARLREVSLRSSKGEILMLAVQSVLENPATRKLAQAADAALLCISLGKTVIAHAECTIEEIGRALFLGSVVLQRGGRP